MVAEISVVDIMNRNVKAIEPDASVIDAAKAMVAYEISGLPVVEDGELIGIITEADLISREIDVDIPSYFSFLDAIIQLPGDDFEDELRRVMSTEVRELMSHPVYSVTEEATVRDLATLIFERHVAPVPVLSRDGEIIGIVSRSDIVRLIAEEDRQETNDRT